MKILIIGGYGNTGISIARLLLKFTSHNLVIAGRNIEKARAATRSLQKDHDLQRVSELALNTGNIEDMKSAMADTDLVIVAASTTSDCEKVVNAAIETQTHYLDTQLSFPYKLQMLGRVKETVAARGLTFITDGGFHPGVPAILVRYAAMKIPVLKKVRIGSLVKMDWNSYRFSDNTIAAFIEEFKYHQPKALVNGSMVKIAYSKPQYFTFRHPFGKKPCSAMWLDELDDLPSSLPDLKDLGFYITGFNWVNDYIVMPLIFMALTAAPNSRHGLLANLMTWSLKKFSTPPFGTELKLEASGEINGKESTLFISLFHRDGYEMTAIPVVATLFQFFEAVKQKPGVWFQGHFSEPERFLSDVRKLGMHVSSGESGPAI